ncbi:MAG TPA: LptF/LptG family permease [bacterium]|nr:LptF/LptG family permease [bacterium]
MAERKPAYMAVALALFAMAFAIGFLIALASIGHSGVLFRFAVSWESIKAALAIAGWAPAILLVASALAMESSEAHDGFTGAAAQVLAPALILAALVSIFYLLVVPALAERKTRYENKSQLFVDSLRGAEEALQTGSLEVAARDMLACAAIDALDERYVELNERVQKSLVVAKAAKADKAASSKPPAPSRTEDDDWAEANRFYLEALRARAEGRLFDAHYLAKRSAAIYSKRPEVRRLVNETWNDLQRLGPSAEQRGEAALYKRKLEGYERFQEGDFLTAYRIYSELASEVGGDADIAAYLKRSAEGLSTIAFFTEEDVRAFSRFDGGSFKISVTSLDGSVAILTASRIAIADEAVYFRNILYTRTGSEPVRVRAPFARLHGDTLLLRAVDRDHPDMVWEPTYETAAGSGFALRLPFNQEDAARVHWLSGAPSDIPINLLATGIEDARRYGLKTEPLQVELAGRMAYPFAVLILALLGAGLGIRFKPTVPPSTATKYLTAPIFVALAIAPIQMVEDAGHLAARAMATWLSPALFIPAWLGFLGACVVISLFVSARIAGRSVR